MAPPTPSYVSPAAFGPRLGETAGHAAATPAELATRRARLRAGSIARNCGMVAIIVGVLLALAPWGTWFTVDAELDTSGIPDSILDGEDPSVQITSDGFGDSELSGFGISEAEEEGGNLSEGDGFDWVIADTSDGKAFRTAGIVLVVVAVLAMIVSATASTPAQAVGGALGITATLTVVGLGAATVGTWSFIRFRRWMKDEIGVDDRFDVTVFPGWALGLIVAIALIGGLIGLAAVLDARRVPTS